MFSPSRYDTYRRLSCVYVPLVEASAVWTGPCGKTFTFRTRTQCVRWDHTCHLILVRIGGKVTRLARQDFSLTHIPVQLRCMLLRLAGISPLAHCFRACIVPSTEVSKCIPEACSSVEARLTISCYCHLWTRDWFPWVPFLRTSALWAGVMKCNEWLLIF